MIPEVGLAEVYCRTCGKKMYVRFASAGNTEVCSKECWQELEWRRTLSILNKEYYADPKRTARDAQSIE